MPIPRFFSDELAEQVKGKHPDDLVFAGIRNGQPLRVSTFRTAFSAAARAIGVLDLHPHQLRHTAASLAIASGAAVKVVQQMLGHSSATMTLDTYGHLFDDRLDEVGEALDAARTAAQQRRSTLRALPRVAPVLPKGVSAGNAEGAPPGVSAGQDPLSDSYPRPDSNRRYRLESALRAADGLGTLLRLHRRLCHFSRSLLGSGARLRTERVVLDLAGVQVDLDQARSTDRLGLLIGPSAGGQRVDVVGEGVLTPLGAGIASVLVVSRLWPASSCARRRSGPAACSACGR